MTRLIVAPVDTAEPGSFDRSIALIELSAELQEMAGTTDLRALAATLRKARQAIAERAQTDDGTPIEAAIAELSFQDFLEILPRLVRAESIPNAVGAPSPSPQPAMVN